MKAEITIFSRLRFAYDDKPAIKPAPRGDARHTVMWGKIRTTHNAPGLPWPVCAFDCHSETKLISGNPPLKKSFIFKMF
jgi:hypothetical protein